MDKQLREDISEAILRRAVIDNHEREMAAIPSNEVLAGMYTPSPAHNKRMNRLFRRERGKEIILRIFRETKKLAVVFMFGMAILFGALLTNPQVQAVVRDTLVSWYDRFTMLRFQGNTGEYRVDWQLGYIPDGFELDFYEIYSHGMFLRFTHTNSRFLIFVYSWADQVAIAISDQTEMSTTIIDGMQYYVFTPLPDSEHPAHVLWYYRGTAFHLTAELQPHILLHIAQSVAVQ